MVAGEIGFLDILIHNTGFTFERNVQSNVSHTNRYLIIIPTT